MTAERIVVDGGATTLVLGVGDDGRLHQLALGGPEVRAAEQAFPTVLYPLALPTFGEEALREPALQVTHADGAVGTRLVHRGHDVVDHDHGRRHRVHLQDRVAPLAVTLHLRTWPDHGLVEQWVEVRNDADAAVTVHQIASASPAVPGDDPHLTHWGGGWAGEWQEVTERLRRGTKTVSGGGGVRSSLHLPPVVLLAPHGPPAEDSGTVLLASVAWGGDVRFDAELTTHRQARLVAGMQHRGAARTLEPGETLTAPAAVLSWSDAGLGTLTRRLHRWVRAHRVRDGHRPRAMVWNNWEAMGFELDEQGVGEVIDGAAALGAELFLLDDGWFGTTHPRDDDTQGLGDWTVDPRKFPNGLAPVVERALGAGMRFGLWIEPEMVNPRSELAEAHPDWVIGEPGRERREERQQLVLDLCRPEVQAFALQMVDDALGHHPAISYLKWDANRDIFEAGSGALPADRQSHLAMDRVRATDALMAEVAARHPEVELMLCASGGGRSSLGDLPHFHELWTSDDTDPVDRVRIQWGASHLLPALVLGAHVTRWGHKPVAFGCAVAMSGRFGVDLDPRTLTEGERTAIAQAIAGYRRIRPLVQFGDLHRLVSPVDGPRGAVAFLAAPDGAPAVDAPGAGGEPSAVAFAFRLEAAAPGDEDPVLRVPGLDTAARYRVEDLTPGAATHGEVQVRTGAELVADGLGWPAGDAPSAAVWLISPAG